MAKDDLIRLMQSLFLPVANTFQEPIWQPAIDVYRTRSGWLIKCELAGVPPKDINVHVAGNRLTISGRRRDCLTDEECNYYRMEITYSHFQRTLELPCDLDHADISTDYQYGMLLIRIRTEEKSK